MQIHYLEIVTPDVDSTCASLAAQLGKPFGEPVAELGNARTAQRGDGSMIGVRAPMHESETPVVRPYWLVKDIAMAVSEIESTGAELAHPPMEIPGYGTFAIYILGGIQHGLWQV
ncbi:MAG: hydroxylase [Gammaproteobacteria bacterium]|nr:hydroxylase [Gammaproteobacteria bacterium]